jgi:hypothetical protein
MPRQERTSQASIRLASLKEIEPVTDVCRDTIRTLINNHNIGFVSRKLARNVHKYMLVGKEASSAFAREPYLVHSLLEKGSYSYWVAVILNFQFISGFYRFMSASLVIFEGVRSDSIKTVLLRAEWDCSDQGGNKIHAQPHWHVYLAAVNNGQENDFEETTEVRDFVAVDTTEVDESMSVFEAKDFHFAMAAQWHIDEDHPLQENLDDVSSLIKWLTGCINYTRDQLEFLRS